MPKSITNNLAVVVAIFAFLSGCYNIKSNDTSKLEIEVEILKTQLGNVSSRLDRMDNKLDKVVDSVVLKSK